MAMSTRGASGPRFTVKYDGPALQDGTMPVRELAPALLALGDLFTRANEIINPTAPPVHLEVRAFRDGSFSTELLVAWQDLVTLLNSPPVQAVSVLVGAIAHSTRGLFALIRFMRGAPLSDMDVRTTEDNSVQIASPNVEGTGNTIIVNNQTFQIFTDPTVRKLASDVARPLNHEGVDLMQITTDETEPPLEITNQDVDAFDFIEESATKEQIIDLFLRIRGIVWSKTHQWRFITPDGQEIRARIVDPKFWESVGKGEPFRDGDVLATRTLMKQTLLANGNVEADYTVLEVIRHHKIGTGPHPQLPFDEGSTNSE